MVLIRSMTVWLSERIRNVVFVVFEEKTEVTKAPPGRLVFVGEPYWISLVSPPNSSHVEGIVTSVG